MKKYNVEKKTIQNIRIGKNQNINSIKINDTRSKTIKIVKIDIKKNRYQNNRQNNFQNNSRHKDKSRKQKTYTNNYKHESFYNFESYEKIDSNEKYDENNSDIQYSYNLILKFFEICKKCEISKKKFISNNSFHAHIRVGKNQLIKITTSLSVKISNFLIIEFLIFITVNNEFEFRNYRYVTI